MESTIASQKNSKKQTSKNHDNTSTSNQSQTVANPPLTDSIIKQPSIHDLTPLQVTSVSPSPPPSITDESSSISVNVDTPSIFQTIISNHQSNEIEILSSNSNKRSYENCEDEPSKRSRYSQDSNRLTYEDISINDMLLVKFDLNQKKEYHGKCLEKNNTKKQLFIHYKGLDSK